MKSFTKGCVFKSYAVEVLTPRLLQGSSDGFEQLNVNLAVIGTKSQQTEEPEDSDNPEIINNIINEAEIRASQKIAEAEVYVKEILREAESKASETIRQSEIEAKEVIERAKKAENQLREELANAVREEIGPQAHSEGYQTGLQKAEIESRKIIEQANALFSLAQRALHEEYIKVDDSLLKLATRIAERLARITLGLNSQKLLEIIRSLALLPQDREGCRIHIAPEDVAWITTLPPGDQLPCPWVQDETLSQGDCFLECQEGIFDARLEVQLDRMEKVLREELNYGGLESTSPKGGFD
ncbi:MAG: FliH/SctL family protein [Desulfitobacteriaceae bacterium]